MRKYNTIHEAAQRGDLSEVQFFIEEQKVDKDTCDQYKDTPLIIAVEGKHLGIVKYLVELGANVNITNYCGLTLLQLAVYGKNSEMIEYLISLGLRGKYSTIHEAIEKEDLSEVQFFIEEKKINKDEKNFFGETPLHVAVKLGHLDIVKYLIENGANKNAYNKIGYTPLRIAIEKDNREIKDYLISKEARGKYSTIHEAIRKGDRLEVEFFIKEKKIDKDEKNLFGETPLHVAAKLGYLDIVEYLIQNGANKEAQNDRGETPLRLVVNKNQVKAMECLIKNGADISDYDNKVKFIFPVIAGVIASAASWFVGASKRSTALTFLTSLVGMRALSFIRNNLAKEGELFENKENDPYYQKGQEAERSWRGYIESFAWPMTYLPFSAGKAFQAGRLFSKKQRIIEMIIDKGSKSYGQNL